MPPKPVKGGKKGDHNPSKKWITYVVLALVPIVIGVLLYKTSPAPMDAQNLINKAHMLDQQAKTVEAINLLLPAVMSSPDWSSGHYDLAIYLRKVGNYSGAAYHNDEALRTNPKFIQAMINGGISYENIGRRDRARELYNRALETKPDFWEAHNSLAILNHDEGKVQEARYYWEKCLALRPDDASVKIKLALMLPPVFASKKDLNELWNNYKKNVDYLANDISLRLQQDAQFAVGMATFYLGYFGFNAKDHMRSVNRMYARADPALKFVAPHLRDIGFQPATSLQSFLQGGGKIPQQVLPRSGGRIRVGIISRHLRSHSIGKLTRGLVRYLPRDRVELFVLFPGQQYDAMSREIEESAEHFVRFPSSLDAARKRISELKLHLLLFMDIGMESFTYFLSFSRLAPVQAMTHGHPITSGVPTMDYFVSFKDYEPDTNQRFYSEELVRIDGHSDRYTVPLVPKDLMPKSHFGFDDDDNVYMAPQSLFKFHPDFDKMVVGILRGDPKGKLAVIQERHAGWAEIVLQRMKSESGLTDEERSRIVFLPRADWSTFMNYVKVADVLVDTFPFGGDTSSREALYMGTPVVTLPAAQLAGRYTQAFLRVVDADELIANDWTEYVEKAIKVGSDRAYRKKMSAKITANRMKLFDDQKTVLAWEQFFVDKVGLAMGEKSRS